MKTMFTSEEEYLLMLLGRALEHRTEEKRAADRGRQIEPEALDYGKLITLAKSHAVLPLLYDVLEPVEALEGKERECLVRLSRQTVQQSYHLLFLSKYVIGLLEEEQISSVLLKGAGTAGLYPVPELRKSGDIDLLLAGEDAAVRAAGVLEQAGFKIKEEQAANHHIVCTSPEGIGVELHTMLTEPFDNERTNVYLMEKLPECLANVECIEAMGVELPVLIGSYQAFYLLLHMLQHFLRAGFGLKLLCDWVVFWNGGLQEEEKQLFLRLVEECQIVGFAEMVTAVCVRYLGLERMYVSFLLGRNAVEDAVAEEFMMEILEAEEFGKSGADRMVIMRGTGLGDYAREFHHQMRLNYPKAGAVILFWPVLWIMTFAGFLYNNRKIRKVSGAAILKKAGKRSRLMERMHLFSRK